MAHRKDRRERENIQDVSVIDLLLMDHRFIKEGLEVLLDEKAEKREKLVAAASFLEAVQKHSQAEKKAIYAPLEANEELHFNVLEAEIEHGIVDKKVRTLRTRITGARTLPDEVEAELKVLAELVRNHLKEEESEILPKMQEMIDEHALAELGASFMKLRKFGDQELRDLPVLQEELIQWKDSVQKVSSRFLSKMDKYVENLKH